MKLRATNFVAAVLLLGHATAAIEFKTPKKRRFSVVPQTFGSLAVWTSVRPLCVTVGRLKDAAFRLATLPSDDRGLH
jgi:hypothetical protein